jgi:hypothetical protein
MTTLAITLAIAIGTAALETWLRLTSRTHIGKRKTGLTKEDSMFWPEWIVTSILALVLSIVGAAHQNKNINISQFWLTVAALFFGFSFLPHILRLWAYEPEAKIKTMKPRGYGWIFVANSAGVLLLMLAVATGVNIYDF